MAEKSPTTSHSTSKENDSIGGEAAKKPSEDEFEDSLNISISEHISEEIESNNNVSEAAEDSIDQPVLRFDKFVAEKKRKLFDFEDSDDKSDAVDNNGIRKFTKFDDKNTNFDELLSGDNIAKHFMVETEMSTSHKMRGKIDEIKIDDVASVNINEGATLEDNEIISASREVEKSKNSEGISVESRRQGNERKSEESNDVILINDHEISLTSLKQLQKQRSKSDTDHSVANQNTTSDISDLLNEDNAKEIKSLEDISGSSIHESPLESSKHDSPIDMETNENSNNNNNESKSESEKHIKSSNKSDNIEQNKDNDENIQMCKSVAPDTPIELSIIEEVSTDEDESSNRNLNESNSDKKNEIQKIIDETVNKLPLDKEKRPSNLRDELFSLSIDSKQLTSSQNSTTTDGTVYNTLANKDTNFENELNLNLIHMQNKIKELQNLNIAKYVGLDASMSNSRRNSLKDSLKDFPQSGRETSSLTTNSTEYRPFQDEYFRVSMPNCYFPRITMKLNKLYL